MSAIDISLITDRLTVHCGGPDCDCLGTPRCRALDPAASAYVDGKPARVLSYDTELGRVVDPAAGVWSEADLDRAAAACQRAGNTLMSRDFHRDLARAALGTVEPRVADLIRAYKRLGGLLSEAETALAAAETTRATAQTNLDALLALYADACATIWLQAVEIQRQAAIITDKVAETRLIQAGPSAGGFRFDLEGGPIQYIAEYLVQMLGHRDPEPTANYCEFEVHHHEVGWMTLTLQRRSGLTPHQKAAAAEAKLAHEPSDAEIEAACEAGWEELRSLVKADPAQGFEIGPWSAVPENHAAKGRAETRAALAAFLAKRRG